MAHQAGMYLEGRISEELKKKGLTVIVSRSKIGWKSERPPSRHHPCFGCLTRPARGKAAALAIKELLSSCCESKLLRRRERNSGKVVTTTCRDASLFASSYLCKLPQKSRQLEVYFETLNGPNKLLLHSGTHSLLEKFCRF